MKNIEKISVVGLGKLGACIAATFAAKGFEVVGLDIDSGKVDRINKGLPPVDEPNLAETIRAGQGKLRATLDPRELVSTDITFFITPSPSLPDGSFSTEYLIKAMRPVARAVKAAGKRGHVFVCNSTTTPGDCDSVLIPMLEAELEGICGQDFGFAYNPEFIALGNVIKGLLEPDMVLIGESDVETGNALEGLYKSYNANSPHIARMSVVSAEITKISLNSYVTMKISFTNQLRMISDQFAKADIHTILDALGNDGRIGKKYLRAGLSFGGPCFPRDNRLLSHVARKHGLEAPLAEASDKVNRMANDYLFQKVSRLIGKDDTVAILGLSYKPDTHITEEAAGFLLAKELKAKGYRVVVHDYGANPDTAPDVRDFEHATSPEELAERSDINLVVICCPWPGYGKVAFSKGTRVLEGWKL